MLNFLKLYCTKQRHRSLLPFLFFSSTSIDSLIYKITPPPLLPIRSLRNITYPVSLNSASDISLLANDSLKPFTCKSISSTITFKSFFSYSLCTLHLNIQIYNQLQKCFMDILLLVCVHKCPLVLFEAPLWNPCASI